MVHKEDTECLDRLMQAIEDKLEAFEDHIALMKKKLEVLKNNHINNISQ